MPPPGRDAGRASPREAEARRPRSQSALAGERDFEAAAEAEAVSRRQRRNLQRFEAVDHVSRGRSRPRPRSDRPAEFVDVGAGDEAGVLGGADDEPASGCSRRELASTSRALRRPPRADSVLARRRPCRTSARRCRRVGRASSACSAMVRCPLGVSPRSRERDRLDQHRAALPAADAFGGDAASCRRFA